MSKLTIDVSFSCVCPVIDRELDQIKFHPLTKACAAGWL